ncbi:type I restriction enzyme HsdR N-terminal domain-containing protein [Staphylococcus simulans]|uniref:type I restriction endonuclease n=1 Tax=Staphylococcus simulans TaxID=1286 RepID=UPI001E33B811|nr:type I restriction endonuclease [Staphylococcus simulans]MCD8916310.1 type I restriction enzyme HsdR N-terminal domain-containing protein [Staphylococcus simulans]
MKEFAKQLEELSERVLKLKENIKTEEATKNALILPFFQKLGYDVFNPLEFTPEFIADVGIKKGEKVDYAIITDDQPTILIECKSVNEKLHNHDSQLFRYFGTSTSKFGILTNGVEYRFYTDLEEPNKMDSKPFLEINLLKLRESSIKELFKFKKENFNIENISSSAYELKYMNLLKIFLNEQLEKPKEDFVKYLLTEVYDGVKTKTVIDRFTPTVKNTLNNFINEKVNDRLNAALNNNSQTIEVETVTEEEEKESKNDIITTPEELESYSMVKVIASEYVDSDRIYYRDNRSYFNILLDNNIRKWIMRIYITNTKTQFILNNEERSTINFEKPLDILKYKEEISEVINKFN